MRRREFVIGSLLAGSGLAFADSALNQALASVPKAPIVRAGKKIVAIDAGHGGRDPGAIGVGGTHEKSITSSVADEVARRLDATGLYKVVLTRPRDEFVPLGDRVRRARLGNSALFLSLHADSGPHTGARGFSVYTLSEHASDDLAAGLAQRENAADKIGGIDFSAHSREVKTILLDLLHRETSNGSLVMAHTVLETLHPPFQPLTNPHRQANFAVLRSPDVPSILVEMGFLSNAEDERLLNQASYQKKLAEKLVRSIDGYFQKA
jgi:N-acetylmuramoyl-L-alanine amidase